MQRIVFVFFYALLLVACAGRQPLQALPANALPEPYHLDTGDTVRVLGFGNKSHYIRAFERKPKHTAFQSLHQRAYNMKIVTDELGSRVGARLRGLLASNGKK